MDTCVRLAVTGFDLWGIALVAVLVIGAGAAVLLLARTRHGARVGALLVVGLLAAAVVTGGTAQSATAAETCAPAAPPAVAPVVNTAPVAVADAATVVEDAQPAIAAGNVLTNDTDADGDTLVVTTAGISALAYGTLEMEADGTFLYTLDGTGPAVDALDAGEALTDTFSYTVSDGHGGTASGALTVTIDGTTDPRAPVAVDDAATVKEDSAPNPVSGNVLTNDTDADGDTLSVTNSGTFTLSYGVLVIHADGTYTYTLDNTNPTVDALDDGQTLTDTFSYAISDGNGGTASATLTVTINGTTGNRAPVVVADTNTVKEDAAPNMVSGNVLANDSDPDGHTMSVSNAGTITLQYGSLEIHADGSYTYTLDNSNPAVDALNNGQHLTDTFTYVASDGHGGTTASTVTIRIDGTTDNGAPNVVADTNTVKEDAAPNMVSGNVLANDSDPDGHTMSVSNAGTITLQYGSLEIHADGSYTYTLDNSNPAVNALDDGQHLTDTFTYVASDGHGGTTASTLTIRIDGTTEG